MQCGQCDRMFRDYAKLDAYKSECGHIFCDTCYQALFVQNSYSDCPLCLGGFAFTRASFKRLGDVDMKLGRELDLRNLYFFRLVRSPRHFDSEIAYNDHLEQVESLLFRMQFGTPEEQKGAKEEAEKQRSSSSDSEARKRKLKWDDWLKEWEARAAAEEQRREDANRDYYAEVERERVEALMSMDSRIDELTGVKVVKEKKKENAKEKRVITFRDMAEAAGVRPGLESERALQEVRESLSILI